MSIDDRYDFAFQFSLDSGIFDTEYLPDSFNPRSKRPHKRFVVARDDNQKAISFYADSCWDWSAYHPYSDSFILDFTSWNTDQSIPLASNITEEIKWLIFVIVWISNGRTKSAETVGTYLRMLSKLANFSLKKGKTIVQVLQSAGSTNRFLDEYGNFYSVTVQSLISIIASETEEMTGIKPLSQKAIERISARSQSYYKNHKQHPPIPTRILTQALAHLSNSIRAFEEYSGEYLEIAGKMFCDDNFGISVKRQRIKSDDSHKLLRNVRPTFDEAIEDKSLKNYVREIGIKTRKQFISHLSDILFLVKLTVLAYSGMRHREACNLKYDCIDTFFHSGKEHYLIKGETTKLNYGNVKETNWVTSTEAAKVIKVARKICDAIYGALFPLTSRKELLLFPKTGKLYETNTNREIEPKYFKSKNRVESLANYIKSASSKSPVAKLRKLVVTNSDLKELEFIDNHRCWRSEDKFIVGKTWTMTAHQFRRSLALYASNSGLVSLPSLRRQLQHITNEMSMYYANGSGFAKDILRCESDFIDEYCETIPESEALSYIRNVIFSDEKLFGAHGAWLSSNKDKKILFRDREETIKRFQNGQLQYQETILGGCTGPKNCKERATRSLVACVDCAGGVIAPSKLHRVIESQIVIVDSLPKDTLVYRTEKDDLDKLIIARDRITLKREVFANKSIGQK
ncbi:hypothetical protein [Aliikangiella sp. IMCC44359]|uniref:hypothetical protein n=1 Tax=Aliikangiella sp. IMCC44359 TaxID=3459125 RepID=UPI00403AB5A2